MAIKYKTNVLALLKNNGYTTYKLRKEKILGESTLQKMRTNILLSWAELNTVCTLLNVQPGDILEFVPDDKPNETHSE
jgi:Predicted transcriptional regulator